MISFFSVTTMNLLIVLASSVFFLILFLYLYLMKIRRYEKLTANIPKVKGLPMIGNVFLIGRTGSDLLYNLDKIMRDHSGDKGICKAWFGPSFLILVSSPEIVGEILCNNKLIDKPFFYDFFFPDPHPSTLFVSSGDLWRKRRKMDAPAFNFQILEGYLDIFNSNSQIYIKNLRSEVGKPGFNIWNYNSSCTLDIISECFLGAKVGIQKKNRLDVIDAFHNLENLFTYRGMRPWLYPNVSYFLSSAGQECQRSLKILYDFLDETFDQWKKKQTMNGNYCHHENEGKKNKTFLDIMFEQRDNGNISHKSLKDEVLGMVIGGYSTNSSTISFVLYCLMTNQHVQEKVVKELDDIFNGSDRDPTMADLQKMIYLDKVIKETLRLYTSVPLIFREVKEDTHLKSGYTLPKGAIVMIFMYHMHRRADIFPNPEVFDPERFNVENCSSRNPYAYTPFSGGSRICIGYKFALLEGKVILSTILRKYKILPPTDDSPDINLAHGMVLRSSTGVHIRIEDR